MDREDLAPPLRSLFPLPAHAREQGQSPALGLGLAVVRRIASAFEGSIRVQSTLGRGSVFILELAVSPRATVSTPSTRTGRDRQTNRLQINNCPRSPLRVRSQPPVPRRKYPPHDSRTTRRGERVRPRAGNPGSETRSRMARNAVVAISRHGWWTVGRATDKNPAYLTSSNSWTRDRPANSPHTASKNSVVLSLRCREAEWPESCRGGQRAAAADETA